MTIYNYVTSILSDIENPVIFEFGVHHAEHTRIIMSNCHTEPTYYGFEADYRDIMTIKKEMPSLKYKLNLIEGAISDNKGTAKFYLSSGFHPTNKNLMTGASSLKKPNKPVVRKRFEWIKFEKEDMVDTYRLDEFCLEKNIPHIDFVWCDIQGAELDMLIGAGNYLKNIHYMFLEYIGTKKLYHGQNSLTDLYKYLGADWKPLLDTGGDILVENTKFKKA